ncbi:ABC transporter substrate-binding protein [Lactococcus hodotermopsidis]|uniref:ABC transporter substrate-binding protein n=1 Tax=Pseudolactococcus hodotermopsidis TaxID=2709157 RepID=A0A6A0BEW2_9LACT|nr:ABC transporter substrate-binding protein [Lactococcus hodotermopsidis]GFH43316.1 ABC transporter substrate-binding protein [Lactococcus hodotermopsidis]
MRKLSKVALSLALSVIVLTGFVACGNTKKDANAKKDILSTGLKTVSIGFPSGGSDWPSGVLGVGKEYGYIDEYLKPLGYKAKFESFVGAAPAIHEALVSDKLDYVVYAGFAGVLGKSKGIDITLLSANSFDSTWKLIASDKSGIKDIKDLKGKKIAYTRGAAPQAYLIKVLEEAGLTFDDIEGINSTIPDGVAGVTTGTIDAAVVVAGQEKALVDDGTARVIHFGFKADPDTYFEPSVFVANTKSLTKNPDVAVAIYKGLLKARDKIAENPEAYYQLSAERSGYDLSVIKEIANPDIEAAFPLTLDDKYINSLKKINKFEVENGLAENSVDFSKFVDKSIGEKAAKEYAAEK